MNRDIAVRRRAHYGAALLPGFLPAVMLLLSACASVTPPPPAPVGSTAALRNAHQRAVTAVPDWRLLGRFALQAEGEGYHGRLDWRQHGTLLELSVSGPFSTGGVALRGDDIGGGIELVDAEGRVTHADNADTLLQQATGLRIPVAGLRYWVRGLPSPSPLVAPNYDEFGRITAMRQDGWDIDYRAYIDADGLSLPRKVFLQRDDLKLRLVVERWEDLL